MRIAVRASIMATVRAKVVAHHRRWIVAGDKT